MRTVLVSGASGIVGYGILRSLRKACDDLRLVGTTIHDDSPAPAFCDIFEKAQPTAEAGYIDWLTGVIRRHSVDLVIPGIEADLYAWLDYAADLAASGVKVVMNRPELVGLCRDKWEFFLELKRTGLPYAIESRLARDYHTLEAELGSPFLLKPRRGFGSKGIVYVTGASTFNAHRADLGETLIAQPVMGTEDEEYTSTAFGNGEGGYVAQLCLRRRLSAEGFTEKAEVEEPTGLPQALCDLCAHFKPLGPTNFQFRLHEGDLKLLEINPRISSSTSLRTAFGFNECRMAVEYYLDGKLPTQPDVRRGKAVRYTEDLILE